jgi:hypothetical protein
VMLPVCNGMKTVCRYPNQGIFWETIIRVAQLTGDTSHIYTVSEANANASFWDTGSFLGPAEYRIFSGAVLGLWNDDIGIC